MVFMASVFCIRYYGSSNKFHVKTDYTNDKLTKLFRTLHESREELTRIPMTKIKTLAIERVLENYNNICLFIHLMSY